MLSSQDRRWPSGEYTLSRIELPYIVSLLDARRILAVASAELYPLHALLPEQSLCDKLQARILLCALYSLDLYSIDSNTLYSRFLENIFDLTSRLKSLIKTSSS